MTNKKKIRVLISNTFDPWFNLATEDWIFKDMDPSVQTLFLWRNSETVVIGRFQNPWVECNTAQMELDNIKLARRQSGGGAVFHDLGNTNFTFLCAKESFSKEANNKIITNALKKFDISAKASGRNDIVVQDAESDKKISGSAFKEKVDRSFHHGTLLINADLTRLQNYLNPDLKKLQSKGITSVKSRVTNLSNINAEINHDVLCKAIINEFFDHYENTCEVEVLDENYLKSIDSLNSYYEILKDWNWRFGETPKFSHQMTNRFDWGNMDVHLDTHKGLIKKCVIFSDSLHPEMIDTLTKSLIDINYEKDFIIKSVNEVKKQLPMVADYLEEFSHWLVKEIS